MLSTTLALVTPFTHRFCCKADNTLLVLDLPSNKTQPVISNTILTHWLQVALAVFINISSCQKYREYQSSMVYYWPSSFAHEESSSFSWCVTTYCGYLGCKMHNDNPFWNVISFLNLQSALLPSVPRLSYEWLKNQTDEDPDQKLQMRWQTQPSSSSASPICI